MGIVRIVSLAVLIAISSASAIAKTNLVGEGAVRYSSINPEILRWARETAGFKLDEVIAWAGFEQVAAWEAGAAYPTYEQLEGLAAHYQRPLALFFFPEVPAEEAIEVTFKSLPASQLHALPASVKLLLRRGKALQLNLHELTDGVNPARELVTDALMRVASSSRDVGEWATAAREFLGIDLDQQQSWHTTAEALKNWRDAFTASGVFVFKDDFDYDDCAGFCLYDNEFPIVFVNAAVPSTRQILTLFHGLAHLVFRNNHIDLTAEESGIDYLHGVAANHREIEQLYNTFSAEFLLSASDLAKELPASYRQTTPKSAGSFAHTKLAYLGKNYVQLVLTEYEQQQISIEQAVNYLGIKASQFDELEDSLYAEE